MTVDDAVANLLAAFFDVTAEQAANALANLRGGLGVSQVDIDKLMGRPGGHD